MIRLDLVSSFINADDDFEFPAAHYSRVKVSCGSEMIMEAHHTRYQTTFSVCPQLLSPYVCSFNSARRLVDDLLTALDDFREKVFSFF